MPVSQGASGGAVPGLGLRAWVLFNGATGAIISQMNVSGVVRSGPGAYNVTFANAMASAQYVTKTDATSTPPNSNNWAHVSSATTAGFNVNTYIGSGNADVVACYVAVYA